MPKKPLPWFSSLSKNIDEEMLGEESFIQMNGYVDEAGNAYVRPGITPAAVYTKNIIGAYPNEKTKKFIVIDASHLTQFEENNTDFPGQLSTASHSVTFGSGKPIYATSASETYIATGARICRVTGSVTATEITGANTPTAATHVAWLDEYVIAIDGVTGQFTWSDVRNPTVWGVYNFANAGGSGDTNQALFVVERQIYLIGSNSTEIWENNGVDPFARVPGGLLEVGTVAKYSVVRDNDALYFLSNKREIVRIKGRTVEKISTPYDKVFASINVEDCEGELLKVFNRTFIQFQFPTAGRTIVYEPATNTWMEFGEWDSTLLQWLVFNCKAGFYSPVTGKQYVLTRRWNSICFFKEDNHADQTAISDTQNRTAPIKLIRRTGFIDHGTNSNKRSDSISMRIKRGSSSLDNAKLSIRWRNNSKRGWSNDRVIDLGKKGDTDFLRVLRGLGAYRARQYEIELTDAVPFSISRIEEEFTLLG